MTCVYTVPTQWSHSLGLKALRKWKNNYKCTLFTANLFVAKLLWYLRSCHFTGLTDSLPTFVRHANEASVERDPYPLLGKKTTFQTENYFVTESLATKAILYINTCQKICLRLWELWHFVIKMSSVDIGVPQLLQTFLSFATQRIRIKWVCWHSVDLCLCCIVVTEWQHTHG